jgi:asparagine synthase (glutamine-hydrolysing)
MSMRHSVEIRVPFLDRELMELVFSMNEKVKFNKNSPKFLLVKAFEGILPNEIQFRNKMGFTFPFDFWMRKELKGVIEGRVNGSSAFNKPYETKLIDGFYNHKIHWSRVWSLIILREYEVPGGK